MSIIEHVYWLTCLETEEGGFLPLRSAQRGKWENSSVRRRRFKLVTHIDKNMMWGNAHVEVEEEHILEDRGFVSVMVQGGCSPSVQWTYGSKASMLDYFSILLCGALCRHEVTGQTEERMVYDLFWQGLTVSSELRDWVKEYAPSFHQTIMDMSPLLLEEGGGEHHQPGCDLLLCGPAEERGLTCSCHFEWK